MRIYRSGLTSMINKNFEDNKGNMEIGLGFSKKKRHFINPRQLHTASWVQIPMGSRWPNLCVPLPDNFPSYTFRLPDR